MSRPPRTLAQLMQAAEGEQSAQFQLEIFLDVKAIANGQEPVLFLLSQLLDLTQRHTNVQNALSRYQAIAVWLHDDPVHWHMIGAKVGDHVPDIVLEFLQRCFKEWEPQMRQYYAQDKERTREYWAAQRQRASKAEDGTPAAPGPAANEISPAIEADLFYAQLRGKVNNIMDLIDEEIESREGHEARLGSIASAVYLLSNNLQKYRNLIEPPFDGQRDT